MQERRRAFRRQADREMYDRARAAAQAGDAGKEARRKQRRAIRHNCEVRMAVRLSHSAGYGDTWEATDHPVKGRIMDLSREGCQVFVGQPLEISQELSLAIGLRSGHTIKCLGVVRWTKGVPQKNGYACGVQFSTIEPKDEKRILAFLKEMDATIGM